MKSRNPEIRISKIHGNTEILNPEKDGNTKRFFPKYTVIPKEFPKKLFNIRELHGA